MISTLRRAICSSLKYPKNTPRLLSTMHCQTNRYAYHRFDRESFIRNMEKDLAEVKLAMNSQ